VTPEEQAQREAVVAEAATWLRTPYHHMGDVKGVGVDCAMILVRVYGAAGIIPADLDPRPYPFDWHLHRSDERYLGWLGQYGALVDEPQIGDVVVWKFGRCYSHAGIYIGDRRVIHSYLGIGVYESGMDDDPLASRSVQFYTLWPAVGGA
jgi:cell wall-associated NlpC family hydrolase